MKITNDTGEQQNIGVFPIYAGFRVRVIAFLIDQGYNMLIVPVFMSLYYYFRDGQTLGYRVMGLQIRDSASEKNVSGKVTLFKRRFFKILIGIFLIGVIWFVFSMVFFVIGETGAGSEIEGSQFLIIRQFANWILGILLLLGLFGGGFHRVTIPFHTEKKGLHDMLAGTVVYKFEKKNVGRMVVGLILFLLSIIVNLYMSLSIDTAG